MKNKLIEEIKKKALVLYPKEVDTSNMSLVGRPVYVLSKNEFNHVVIDVVFGNKDEVIEECSIQFVNASCGDFQSEYDFFTPHFYIDNIDDVDVLFKCIEKT